MPPTIAGRLGWGGARDNEGFRTYSIKHLIKVEDPNDDGPKVVMDTPGLPEIGSLWSFGNDADDWAYCTPFINVRRVRPREKPGVYWTVEQRFTNRAVSDRCQDTQIDDPLLEPQKLSGSFVTYTREATRDRNNKPILTSSHERITGAKVEFDDHNATVRIEQNVASLGLETFTDMMNKVNNNEIWGLTARKIKLSNISWQRKLQGTCDFYYTRIFDFDVNFNTFDRVLQDEGRMVLNGHWGRSEAGETEGTWILDNIDGSPPDKNDPRHFMRFKDLNDENAVVILDGDGKPATDIDPDAVGGPGQITVEYYDEVDFLLLGIPASLTA